MYFIIEISSKRRIGRALETLKRALRKADRLNLEYGCHNYHVVDINGATFY